MKECLLKPLPETEGTASARVRRVCFVCTGNTCRSPMAEAVVNAWMEAERAALPETLRELILPRWEAVSAGLYACEGDPIAANAVAALEAAEIPAGGVRDYHRHTAHLLDAREAEECDLLVGMSAGHAMELLMRFPHLAQRIVCMPQEISDPYGGDLARYTACLGEIIEGVRLLLAREDDP